MSHLVFLTICMMHAVILPFVVKELWKDVAIMIWIGVLGGVLGAASYADGLKVGEERERTEQAERYLKKHNYPTTFVACGNRVSGQEEAIGYLEKWRANLSTEKYTLVDIGELAVLHCIAGRAPLIDAVQELWSSRYEVEPTNKEHESFDGPCAVKVQTELINKVLKEYDAQKESGEGTQ